MRKIVLLSALLTLNGLYALDDGSDGESARPVIEQLDNDGNLVEITFDKDSGQKSFRLNRGQFEYCKTLKDMSEDLPEVCLKDVLDIIPNGAQVFGALALVSKNEALNKILTDQDVQQLLAEKRYKKSINDDFVRLLEDRKEEQLVTILQGANYLDIAQLIKAGVTVVADRLSTEKYLKYYTQKRNEEKIKELQVFDQLSYGLQVLISKKILHMYPELKTHLHEQCKVPLLFSFDGTLLHFNAAGNRIAILDNKINLFDCETGVLIKEIDIDRGGQRIWGIKSNAAGTRTAILSGNKMNLIDYATGALIKEIDTHHGGQSGSIEFNAVKNSIVIKFSFKTKLFDWVTGELIKEIDQGSGLAWRMEFNAAGNCIAKQLKNKVELLDCTTGALIKEIYHGGKKILDMRCNAAESCIATRSKTKVKLSDCTTGTLIKEIDHGGQIIVDMKFNTAGTSIATRTLSEIKLFDYETGMLIKEIDIEGLIRDMVFHPSGTCIAVLSSHGSWCSKPQYKVKLFDCITGAFIKVIDKVIDPDIEHSVSIEFNAAGNRIATQKLCRVGSQVKIWDLSDLQSIKNLERNLLIFETLNLLTLSNACRDKIRTEEDYALLKTMPSALQECFDVDESLKNMDIDTKGSK